MSRLPPWARPPSSLHARESELARALTALRQEHAVSIAGPLGSGTTALGGALAQTALEQGLVNQIAAVPLDRLATLADALWHLGTDLDAELPGDQASLERCLRAGGTTLVLLDDAHLAPDVVRELGALFPDLWWVLTGERAIVEPSVALTPLDPGERVLREVAEPRTLDGPVLHESLRRSQPSASALASALREYVDELHALGADVDDGSLVSLRAALRAASRSVADPELRALATAGAARLALRAWQTSEALDLVRNGLMRQVPAGARGLLLWLEGDALVAMGSEDEAHQVWLHAAASLQGAGQPEAASILARRCAAREASRGRYAEARSWLATARATRGDHTSRSALAQGVRIAGDLAASAGELVGAQALYDEAEDLLSEDPSDPAWIGLRLGLAGLDFARGQYGAAADQLARAEAIATRPTERAALALRRAEVALRRGRRQDAATREKIARQIWRRWGDARGLALCARLRGDLCAVVGDRLGARHAWDEALQLCQRHRDLATLRSVLQRILAIEREGVPGPHLDEIQRWLDLAEVAARVRS